MTEEDADLAVPMKQKQRSGLESQDVLQKEADDFLTSFQWAPLPKISDGSKNTNPLNSEGHVLDAEHLGNIQVSKCNKNIVFFS